MQNQKIVIIGGDAAGMSAASKIRRELPEWEIVVFEKSPHTSYSACGIPYFIGGVVEDKESLIARSPETFIQKYNIKAHVMHEVIQIDTAGKKVLINDLNSSKSFTETYDQLLIATGASPAIPEIEGINAKGVFSLSTLQSGIELFNFIERHTPKTAVIVGGGYIGIEVAEALLQRKIQVTLIDRASYIMETLDREMSEEICRTMTDAGVDLRLGESLKEILSSEKGYASLVKTNISEIKTDLVVLGTGVKPNTQLARDAGLKLSEGGAILVNNKMQTSIKDVWAAGDCASSYHILKDEEVFIALGTIANKQGLVAGTNMGGGEMFFQGVCGTAITKFNDLEISRTGLSETEAKKMGIEIVSNTISTTNYAAYYPGNESLKIKLIAKKKDKEIIGGQIVGGKGSAKRIDTIVAAIKAKMNVYDLAMLDLSYAPPFSGVWDPLQIAARTLM
ncbi:MAG: CoA-disulfide reductase [Cyclobacteriaceae bacterium]|nr:CoA-disulfide reductase [Cyclobacteriaceae bacterium]